MTDEPPHVTDDPRRAARRTRGLAYVCENFPYLRETLPSGDAVERLLDAVRERRTAADVDAALDALHHQVQAAGDAFGVYGGLRGDWFGRGDTAARPVGFSAPSARPAPGDDTEKAYLCPHGRCARYVWPEAAAADGPECAIDGRPMPLRNL